MARHLAVTETSGAPVYFCDSRSPWKRGSNENTNGLLRDLFPKGTDVHVHSAEHLLAVENERNNRPRRVLDDRSPATLFERLLCRQISPCCDVDWRPPRQNCARFQPSSTSREHIAAHRSPHSRDASANLSGMSSYGERIGPGLQ